MLTDTDATAPMHHAPNATGASVSVWMGTSTTPQLAPQERDIETDVCIVGAGIAGLTTAYLLAREGRAVVVLDSGPVGGGETGRTTAHLTNAIDDRYREIEKHHGQEKSRLAADSHTRAIATIEEIVAREKIPCRFERVEGYLFLDPERDRDYLEGELEAVHRAGLTDVTLLPTGPDSAFSIGACLRFARQGQFHVLEYLAGLTEAIRRLGGTIVTSAHVESVESTDGVRVTTTQGHRVTCNAAVMATNVPVLCPASIYSGQMGYRTYVVAMKIAKGALRKCLYWDTATPYHYVRVLEQPDYDVLIAGGEDHKTGQANDAAERYMRLEAWTRARCAVVGETLYRWSGQVMEPADGLAIIGAYPDKEKLSHVYLITGDSGMGMTHATAGALLVADLIAGRTNPWTELYDPARSFTRSLAKLVSENVNTVARLVSGLVTKPETPGAESIPLDSGAVVGEDSAKQAVYRDGDGVFHRMSASCTHLGCVVAWNADEKTWDCPCHASVFDRLGRVVHGPALTDLESAS